MKTNSSWKARQSAFMNRLHAARAGRKSYSVEFTAPPETRPIGDAERGRQIFSGRFAISGRALDAGERLWDLPVSQADDLQSFVWLDDLMALGDGPARARAVAWIEGWIVRFGRGQGWTAEVAARRVWHWQGHLEGLLSGLDGDRAKSILQAFARQVDYLGRAWPQLEAGTARLDVLASAASGALSLRGMEEEASRALAALSRELEQVVSLEGTIATRSPEDLLALFASLSRVAQLVKVQGRSVPEGLSLRIDAMGHSLRALRHGDGSLARFQGGGGGQAGLLDAALFAAGIKGSAASSFNMGFARMTAGRVVVLTDAHLPPSGAKSHASALAFEMSVARRPLIVSCGDGSVFGAEWHIASRAPASHSVLVLEGGHSLSLRSDKTLEGLPSRVLCERSEVDGAVRLEMAHDGWSKPYGLVHARQLDLAVTGRALEGEDLLVSLTEAEKRAFDRAFALSGGRGLGFAIRFHLHPDVVAMQDGEEVTLVLKSGEVWSLRHDGGVSLTLEASVYLEKGQARPRTAQQVVLTGHAMSYATRIRWRLVRAHETSDIMRAKLSSGG